MFSEIEHQSVKTPTALGRYTLNLPHSSAFCSLGTGSEFTVVTHPRSALRAVMAFSPKRTKTPEHLLKVCRFVGSGRGYKDDA
jgi:hypothetical protein